MKVTNEMQLLAKQWKEEQQIAIEHIKSAAYAENELRGLVRQALGMGSIEELPTWALYELVCADRPGAPLPI